MKSLRLALVTVLALTALVLSLAVMHAAMVSISDAQSHEHTTAMSMTAAQADSPAGAAVHPSTPDGGMSPMDCLLFGMVCFLMAVAVLLLAVLVVRLRSLLRSHALQLLVEIRGRLQPPRPPSLLELSISRV